MTIVPTRNPRCHWSTEVNGTTFCAISCFAKEVDKKGQHLLATARNYGIPQHAYARDCGSGKNDSIEGFADNAFRLAISCFRRNHRNAVLLPIVKYREKPKKKTIKYLRFYLEFRHHFCNILYISWITIKRNKNELDWVCIDAAIAILILTDKTLKLL